VKAAALALALLLAGCAAADPYARKPDGVQPGTLTLPHEQVAYPTFGAQTPVHARVTWNATQRIDVWIAPDYAHACAQYGTRQFAPAAAMLNSTGGVLEADLPNGTDCLVLDNTDFAEGRAPAGPDAVVNFTIEVWARGT
jgi:hypothetical protein